MKKINKTKLPKITQLPSGSYTTKVFVEKDDSGRRVYKSITDPDYDKVAAQAAQFKLDKKQEKLDADDEPQDPKDIFLLGQAFDSYISSKTNILSPSTIREYKRIRRSYFQNLMSLPISAVTQQLIQESLNADALNLSPKSLRNNHGLLSAVLAAYNPSLKLTTTLPRKVKPDIEIPSTEEMARVFDYATGTDMEIPIYLAACCGMRRSEIAALKWSDVNLKKKKITIREALVINDEAEYVLNGTKSTDSKRIIRIFPFVLSALEKSPVKEGSVTNLPIYMLYNKWQDIQDALKMHHYRFHDLRHYTASVMLMLNIPKKYIADYLGHKTEAMVEAVYGHIMREAKSTFEDTLQDYFTKMVDNVKNAKSETKSETR
jgi:Integrase